MLFAPPSSGRRGLLLRERRKGASDASLEISHLSLHGITRDGVRGDGYLATASALISFSRPLRRTGFGSLTGIENSN